MQIQKGSPDCSANCIHFTNADMRRTAEGVMLHEELPQNVNTKATEKWGSYATKNSTVAIKSVAAVLRSL